MAPPKFTYRRSTVDRLNNQIKFQCSVNRQEDARGRAVLNARGRAQCFRCLARKGAKFQTPEPRDSTRADQCTRHTCLSQPFCWQHLAIVCHLRIMKSKALASIGINALGLYAWDPKAEKGIVLRKAHGRRAATTIRTGLKESPFNRLYVGEKVTAAELTRRYEYHTAAGQHVDSTAPYGLKMSGHLYDAACVRGALAYANDANGIARFRNNCRISHSGNLVATRNVHHGEEILVNYGPQYWRGNTYVPSGTKVRKPAGHVSTAPVRVKGRSALGIPNYVSGPRPRGSLETATVAHQ